MTDPKQTPHNKKAKSLLPESKPATLEDCTFSMLPKDPSENGARARRVAVIIGDPLRLEGVDPITRKTLEQAIRSGDPHGMLDFGLKAMAESKQPKDGSQKAKKSGHATSDTPATTRSVEQTGERKQSHPANPHDARPTERGIATPLRESAIIKAAVAYFETYGELPEARWDREVPGMPGESWIGINVAGFYGHRGLERGRTLREILKPLRRELGL